MRFLKAMVLMLVLSVPTFADGNIEQPGIIPPDPIITITLTVTAVIPLI